MQFGYATSLGWNTLHRMNKSHRPPLFPALILAFSTVGEDKGHAACTEIELTDDARRTQSGGFSLDVAAVHSTLPTAEETFTPAATEASGETPGGATFQVELPSVPERFGPVERAEFHRLTVKTISGKATTEEENRFLELQELGRAKISRSPDEVLAEYQRGQAAIELRSFLKRHARFFQRQTQ